MLPTKNSYLLIHTYCHMRCAHRIWGVYNIFRKRKIFRIKLRIDSKISLTYIIWYILFYYYNANFDYWQITMILLIYYLFFLLFFFCGGGDSVCFCYILTIARVVTSLRMFWDPLILHFGVSLVNIQVSPPPLTWLRSCFCASVSIDLVIGFWAPCSRQNNGEVRTQILQRPWEWARKRSSKRVLMNHC